MREKYGSSGIFKHTSCSRKKSAKNHKDRLDDVIVIDDDDDSDSSSDVIVIDIPESLQGDLKEHTGRKRQNNVAVEEVISIDDDESNVSNRHGVGVQGSGDLDSDATSKKPCRSADNYYSWSTPWFRADKSQATREKGSTSKSKECRKTSSKTAFCSNRYGLYSEPEGSSSESEFLDCEIIEDSCGFVREKWQQASFRRKNLAGSNDRGSASCSMYDTQKNVEQETLFSAARSQSHGHGIGGSTAKCPEEKQSPEGSSLGSIHDQDANVNNSHPTSSQHKEPNFTTQFHTSDFKSQLDTDLDMKFPVDGGEDDIFYNIQHMNKTPIDRDGVVFTDNATTSSSIWRTFPDRQSKSKNIISKNTDKTVPEQPVASRSFGSEKAQDNCCVASEKFRGYKEMSSVSNPSFGKSGINSSGAHMEANRMDPIDKANEPLIDARITQDKFVDRDMLQADSNGIMTSTSGDMIINREKFKETDEYKHAMEAEWVARREQLRIQAEESQRLRKRRRAESLRLLEMERRQKQRLEEIRNAQKKDEENMNLKEQLRGSIRKEVHILELKSYNMASLLRSLGIHVGGGVSPSLQEVHAAYKRSLLKFHPDRTTRSDIPYCKSYRQDSLILKTLNFNIHLPTPYSFMTRFLKAAKADKRLEFQSLYNFELWLLEYEMVKFPPSLLAAAAIYTAQFTLERFKHWNKTMELYSKYSVENLLGNSLEFIASTVHTSLDMRQELNQLIFSSDFDIYRLIARSIV